MLSVTLKKPHIMKSLKKIAALAVVLIGIFAFSTKTAPLPKSSLNLEAINVVDMLSKQQFECRPSSDVMFYVETNIVKKIRGANNINAKVYLVDRASGNKSLLAVENLQINKFEGAIAIGHHDVIDGFAPTKIANGDKIIGSLEKAPYSFKELIKYEAIYNAYINATNKLLDLKRTI